VFLLERIFTRQTPIPLSLNKGGANKDENYSLAAGTIIV
jgi:hypothetical protein